MRQDNNYYKMMFTVGTVKKQILNLHVNIKVLQNKNQTTTSFKI